MIKNSDSQFIKARNGKLLIEILPDKCDFCGCCVGVCPEDAIELKEASISIIGSLCTNCSKCIWSCPLEVIKFNKEGIYKPGYPIAALKDDDGYNKYFMGDEDPVKSDL